MAIESSNRNPNPNPNFANSRNQTEKRGDGGVRRSANGSPFSKPSVVAHPTPWCLYPKTTSANSPALAENARRSSFSKETATMGLSMNEHKENKKPNPNSKGLRGSKNFMSPTISAVSKATPSPRKKVLAERNEAIRTSASLSDGKFLFFAAALEGDLKGETESCEFQKEIHKKKVTFDDDVVVHSPELLADSDACGAKKRVTFDDGIVVHSPELLVDSDACGANKRVTFDDDIVVLSPELLAGSDFDEPFEPLFVAERIKPVEFSEIEQKEPCLNISKPIAFVSSPPSPIAPLDADPSVPSYDPNTNFLSPRPQFLRYNPHRKVTLYLDTDQPKNLEDSLSSETCSDNDMEEIQSEEIPVQEEEFTDSSSSVAENESSVASKTALKPRFFTIWRAITWIMLFGAIAFLSSSLIASNAPEGVLSKVYETNHQIYKFVKTDFSSSLQGMRKWSATYLPLMMSSFRETGMATPSQFLNFSEMVCDANDHHFVEHKALSFPLHPEVESHPKSTLEEAEFEAAELPNPGVESQPLIEDVASEQPVIEDAASEPPVMEDAASEPPVMEDAAPEPPVIEDVVFEQPVSEDVSSQQPEVIEQIESGNEVVLDALEEPNSYYTAVESVEAEAVTMESLTIEGSAENQQIMGSQGLVAFLVASLCVVTAFSIAMIAKYKKANKSSSSTTTGQAEMLSSKEESFHGNPSHGSQMEVEDMDAETYNQSEMSSYSFHDKPVERASESEAESKERKQSRRSTKRESLASSSSEYPMGSASYGSFTTYSILPTKNGDEEYVTPVRRSSRIRKHVIETP